MYLLFKVITFQFQNMRVYCLLFTVKCLLFCCCFLFVALSNRSILFLYCLRLFLSQFNYLNTWWFFSIFDSSTNEQFYILLQLNMQISLLQGIRINRNWNMSIHNKNEGPHISAYSQKDKFVKTFEPLMLIFQCRIKIRTIC